MELPFRDMLYIRARVCAREGTGGRRGVGVGACEEVMVRGGGNYREGWGGRGVGGLSGSRLASFVVNMGVNSYARRVRGIGKP